MTKTGTMNQSLKYNADRSRSFHDIMIPVRSFGGKEYHFSGSSEWNTRKEAKEYAEQKYVPMGYKYRIVECSFEKRKGYLIYVRK